MSAITYVLPFEAVDQPAEFPIFYFEPLDFLGSLILLDPSHEFNSSLNGFNLQNILSHQAAEIIDASDLNASIELLAQGGGLGRFQERTSKNAVHLYYGASRDGFNGDIERYNFPESILNHIKTSGHEFYFALSHRITYNPVGLGSDQSRNQWSGIVYNDNLAIYSFDTQSDKPTDSHRTYYNRVGTATDETLGLVHRAIAIDGTESVANHAIMFASGRNSNWTNTNAKAAGSILYTFYVCDLTVANKTAAEVDAIFQARQAALFADDGRYADDTWTDPATK